MTTHPVEPAGDQRRSADSPAEVEAVGNRAPQVHAVGEVAEAAEAGEVAAPVAVAGEAVEVSVAEEDEDRSRLISPAGRPLQQPITLQGEPQC